VPCFWSLVLVLLVASFARAADPPAHRVNGDLAIRARAILHRYCAECHTGSPDPGKSKLKILDYTQVTAKGRPVPLVAPGGRSQILELIRDGSMPPANRPGPSAEEIEVLEKWIGAQAPAYPQAFDDRFVLQAIADDFDRASAQGRVGNAGEFLRYVSFAHLVRDGQPLPDLAAAERRLNEALALVTGSQVKATPITPTGTVYRIDLDALGWRTRELFERVERRKPAGAHSLRPFDLLLLEYPFAESRPASEYALTYRLEKLLDAKVQERPVAFVQGDWLTAALVRDGKLTPLADDIKSLGALARAFGSGIETPDGPPVPRQLGTAAPQRVARPSDGRTPIPPLSGWYAGAVAPDPPPFALTAELVSDAQPVKSVKVDQRFKLKVSSDRRVFVTLLMIQADGEVRVQEVAGGSVLQPNAARELSPGGEGFSISGIITGGDATTEYFVLFAAEAELPPPTIVRSLHPDRRVWRFLLEPTARDAYDPNKVVRTVIPIPVTKK
jgi:hypothetical protein